MTGMKTLILLSLLSLSAQAADYSCLSGRYRYALSTDVDSYQLTITDIQGPETQYFGVADEVIQDDEFTESYFKLNRQEKLKLTFKTQALKEELDVLYGISFGTYGGSAFKCYRNEKRLKR